MDSPGTQNDFEASPSRKQSTVLIGKTSNMGSVIAGVPQGAILGPLFFLVYTKDLTEDLRCNAKLFAGDTSHFTIVRDANAAASDLNHDLDILKAWASKWRMSFNHDPNKQAIEVTFSTRGGASSENVGWTRSKIDRQKVNLNVLISFLLRNKY